MNTDILTTLRHTSLFPSHIKDMENGLAAVKQCAAEAADEIEVLRIQKEGAESIANVWQERCLRAEKIIADAHAAIDEAGIIMRREESRQDLTPRIKSLIARCKEWKNYVDLKWA
jgi:hypothetical protein